jgi:hypothetical protein
MWLKGQVIISPSYLKYAEYEHEPGEGAAAVLILHNRSFQNIYPEGFTIFFIFFEKRILKTDILISCELLPGRCTCTGR